MKKKLFLFIRNYLHSASYDVFIDSVAFGRWIMAKYCCHLHQQCRLITSIYARGLFLTENCWSDLKQKRRPRTA